MDHRPQLCLRNIFFPVIRRTGTRQLLLMNINRYQSILSRFLAYNSATLSFTLQNRGQLKLGICTGRILRSEPMPLIPGPARNSSLTHPSIHFPPFVLLSLLLLQSSRLSKVAQMSFSSAMSISSPWWIPRCS